ncbi:hypothetical protein SAMN04488063_1209 [Halopelagius inordinatus]|uniref:Membrane domain of glycerophosphoryl diester phosphodiesterase n=1 Tax=Halopelagius inordinatus TaxID=553467 RepID=A0A1I2NQG5_9EURY|nr:hypothetical protein [Halopelagius inordinatus]SFG03521.1 hypothetical protein SAMN04488063_1209 [Halopelagius inordinatus]
MSWNAVDALSDARTATESLLLPFDARTWAKLALVVFFVGTGTNASVTTNGSGSASSGTGGSGVPFGSDVDLGAFSPNEVLSALGGVSALRIAAGIALIFALLFVLHSFLAAVFEFVFVVGVADRDVRIRGPFRSHLGDGARLFAFRLLLGVAAFSLFAVPVAAALLGAVSLGPELFLVVIPVFLVGVVVALLVALVLGLTRDFVVPAMLVEDCGVLAGWRRVLPTMRAEWEEFALYVVVRFGLGILVGAVMAVALALVALVVAVPFVLLGGALFLAFSPLSGALSVGSVLLGAVVFLYVVALAVAGLFVSVPVAVYFRYYSLLLLAGVDSGLDVVGRPDEPTDDARDAGAGDAAV